uniref:tRNA threonylcarbamoyladenosine biosynthesis protein TsaE n=1 Tax=Candidatus Aschnera chinzeii TaxID=1485666 RepID=A0AAT9G3T4_9ENTR|nr:MAG: tRNA (adenosine(37)-N6)-threonylcarbamoyltransferase complex ATPase subunit type 1 TsaE [Candidatus Aschnera chinzeii]
MIVDKNTILLANENKTINLGYQLAKNMKNNFILFLYGNIGVGKTTLVRGFLQGLGYENNIKSPSYSIIESYLVSDYSVYHIDLYRLNNAREFEILGMRDFLSFNSICLFEWPQNGGHYLPTPDLVIKLSYHLYGRKAKLISHTMYGNIVLQKIFVY